MSIDFRVRDFGYPLSIWRLRRQFERSQWWSLDELRAYQDRLLRNTIAHAYATVPYYQDLFRQYHLKPTDFNGIGDLAKMPTLPKDTLRSEFQRLHAADAPRYRPHVYRTSGSSGEPVRFLLDKPANILEFVYYWRHWSWAGYALGARFAELTTHHFMRSDALSQRPWRYQAGLGRLLLNNMAMSLDAAIECVKAMRRHRPLFLKGLASALSVFAHYVQQAGITDLQCQAIFSTGEVLITPQRRLIEETFHGKVFDSYGHMERTVAVSECAEGSLHVNPEYGVLELVDKRPIQSVDRCGGRQLFAARVLGTSLHTRSMPLLRYEIGDVLEVDDSPQPCACGRSMPRVHRIHGRCEDAITTPDGRVVTAAFLVFDEIDGIVLGQLLQEMPDRLTVRIVPGREYTRDREIELLALLRRFVGQSMRIDVEYVSIDALRASSPGKWRAVRSLVRTPLATAAAAEAVNA